MLLVKSSTIINKIILGVIVSSFRYFYETQINFENN